MRLHSPRSVTALAAALLTLATGAEAAAQSPELDVYYLKLDPKDSLRYKWHGQARLCNIGAFRWSIPASEFGTGGFDRHFTGYCAEIDKPMTTGITYRFRTMSLFDPHGYGLDDSPNAIRAADRRAHMIRELFGRYYTEDKIRQPDHTFAFQLALWELTHETEPVDRAAKFDLFSGDFQVDYPRDEAPAFVPLAQQFLDSLTGDDSLYDQNPDVRGRELVRLKGIPNPEGIIAQDQYVLRYTAGGFPGTGTYTSTTSNGPGGFSSGGGPGGFGGLSGGPGGGTGALGIDPIGAGGSGGFSINPVVPPSPPPSPPPRPVPPAPPIVVVPAPAGFLLGVIAVGALSTRRLYRRFWGPRPG